MEETILVGDDLMMGPPSPLIPPEIASHVLEGVDLCDGILKNLFLCKFCIIIFLILLLELEFTLDWEKPSFYGCFISYIMLGPSNSIM